MNIMPMSHTHRSLCCALAFSAPCSHIRIIHVYEWYWESYYCKTSHARAAAPPTVTAIEVRIASQRCTQGPSMAMALVSTPQNRILKNTNISKTCISTRHPAGCAYELGTCCFLGNFFQPLSESSWSPGAIWAIVAFDSH